MIEGHHGFPKKAEGFGGEIEQVPCGMEGWGGNSFPSGNTQIEGFGGLR